MNLGNPTRALATEDPDSTVVLPMDDDAWDRGVRPHHYVYSVTY
jgi:hypothetical protein